jgi:6-phosphogluconolactonase (cycloisomerase 2 family)
MISTMEISKMHFGKRRIEMLHLLLAAAVITCLALPATPALAAGDSGDVYVLTNQSSGNSIMLFQRDAAGNLTLLATYVSGGNGAGSGADPLGSQLSLVLNRDQRLLFAVNAGSNSLSVFAVFGNQLKLLDTVSSGGVMPVSVAVRHEFVYVLNAGGNPNIAGFRIQPETGHLILMAGSVQNLPGGTASMPAEVAFRPDGGTLVVTEKGTNAIDTFSLDDGVAQPGASSPSSGTEPFGFDFGRGDATLVSNASGGVSGASTVASYSIGPTGKVSVITPALGDTQSAACWLVVTKDGRFAYVANTGSGTISSYTVSDTGSIALLNTTAATLASGAIPIDMALTDDGEFLYVRDAGHGAIVGFSIGIEGSLTQVASVSGVPAGAQGIAAR